MGSDRLRLRYRRFPGKTPSDGQLQQGKRFLSFVDHGNSAYYTSQYQNDVKSNAWSTAVRHGVTLQTTAPSIGADGQGNAILVYGYYASTEVTYTPNDGWGSDNFVGGGKANEAAVSQSGFAVTTSQSNQRGITITLSK